MISPAGRRQAALTLGDAEVFKGRPADDPTSRAVTGVLARALGDRDGFVRKCAATSLLRLAVEDLFAGKIALVSSFGADSAVLLDMIAGIDPRTPVVFIDTGQLFPETLAYRDALLARYANAALKHRTAQIAMDGSQKIPPRLLATIEARLNAGQSIERLTLAVAAWLVFLRGHADDGTRYEISDPMAARLTANLPADPERLVATMLAIKEVFPHELANREVFRRQLVDAVSLLQKGALQAIAIERN